MSTINEYKQNLAATISSANEAGLEIKRFVITAVLRDVQIIEKSSGDIVLDEQRLDEPKVRALKASLEDEYPNCSLTVSDSAYDRVLAQEVTEDRYDPESSKESAAPMVLNASSFIAEKLAKGTRFLMAASEFATFADDGGYKTFCPIMNEKVWGLGESEEDDEEIAIFGVQLAKANRKFDNRRLSSKMKRVS